MTDLGLTQIGHSKQTARSGLQAVFAYGALLTRGGVSLHCCFYSSFSASCALMSAS